MKKVSVITINYNNAAGLKKTIESVTGQTGIDVEYIVIDGGSADGSRGVIEENKNKISYWVSEKDSGIYNAMNKGIAKAGGDYCLFLNSGDYLYNNTVLNDVFTPGHDADIIYGNMQIDLGNGKMQVGKMPEKITFEHMYRDTLWHPVSFIKRELFKTYGLYNETYRMVADYEFFFRVIVMNAVSLKRLDRIISVYNLNGLSSLPENKRIEKAERLQVLQTYLPPLLIEFADRHCPVKKDTESFLLKLKRVFKIT